MWGAHPQLPYKWEEDRRDVIEVAFDSEEALLLQTPEDDEIFLQVGWNKDLMELIAI